LRDHLYEGIFSDFEVAQCQGAECRAVPCSYAGYEVASFGLRDGEVGEMCLRKLERNFDSFRAYTPISNSPQQH
jgi:hypothetical protein